MVSTPYSLVDKKNKSFLLKNDVIKMVVKYMYMYAVIYPVVCCLRLDSFYFHLSCIIGVGELWITIPPCPIKAGSLYGLVTIE